MMSQLILAISLRRVYLPLIQKDSVTHMYSLSVYVKELIHFARDLSLENFSTDFTSLTVFLLLFYRSPPSSLCTVFDSISSNIVKVLSINPSVNVFVFGDFNVHHKDQLTYSDRTDRSGYLC